MLCLTFALASLARSLADGSLGVPAPTKIQQSSIDYGVPCDQIRQQQDELCLKTMTEQLKMTENITVAVNPNKK